MDENNRKNNKARMLWWIADNKDEAGEWVGDLGSKGAKIVKVERQSIDRPHLDVVFALDPERAMEILGYIPGEEEWLQEEDKKITLDLNIFDDGGNVVDGATAELTVPHVSAIVDQASQLILLRRAGKPIEDVLAELDEALTSANVLAAEPSDCDGEHDAPSP